MRGRRLPALVLALALLTSTAACSTSSSGSSTTTSQSTTPVFAKNGTVVVAVPSLPTNFNPSAPQGANQVTSEVMAQVWPQTFVTDPELSTTAEAGFLEDAEVESLSPFTVVYTLNPKAVWSDGAPIGLADFVYNWQEQLKWAALLPDPGLAAGYEAISSITAGSTPSTVDVRFSRPYTAWESLFSNLVPAQIGQRYGWVAAFAGFNPARVVSGGPFEISSYTPGRQLVLSRNPHYWFTPAGLAHIIFRVEPAGKVLGDLARGSVGIGQVTAGPAADGAVAAAARRGEVLTKVTADLPTLWQLCFNLTDPTLGSVAFRDGLQYSLDLDEIAADSVGLQDASAVPYSSRLELGVGSPFGPGTNGLGNGPSSNGSPSPPPGGYTGLGIGGYDLAAAVSSFRAAGYVADSQGILRSVKTGAQAHLSLLVPTGVAAVASAAEVIQAELDAVGIAVTLQSISLSAMLSTVLPSGSYQMALAPFLLSTFPVDELPVYTRSVLPAAPSSLPPSLPARRVTPLEEGRVPAGPAIGSEPGAPVGGVVTRDVFGLDDPTLTSDLTEAMTNLNPAQDLNLVNAAEARLWLDLPTIPLFQQPVDVVYDSNIRSVSVSPTWAGIFWNAEDWLIQKSPPVAATQPGS